MGNSPEQGRIHVGRVNCTAPLRRLVCTADTPQITDKGDTSMQEQEIGLKDMLLTVLRRWRKLMAIAVIVALLTGLGAVVVRFRKMHDDEQVIQWQAEYDASYGAYWAAINDYDRQIAENGRMVNAVQVQIDALDLLEANLQDDILDTESMIQRNKAKVRDYEASIESLELRKEELGFFLRDLVEQNENSLYMTLDPYHIAATQIYLRVDTGYQVIPSATYQDPDRTQEVLQTYQMLVTNTEFLTKMIETMQLDTGVRYLNELIRVDAYNENSLRVQVIGETEAWTEQAAGYICSCLLQNAPAVSETVTDHTMQEYSRQTYSYIDLGVYSEQQSRITQVSNYESSIRAVDAQILDTNTAIRNLLTDNRNLTSEIERIKDEIRAIPDTEEGYRSEIAAYEDAKYVLLSEQLELKAKPEPQYEGYTSLSLLTGFVKLAIVGVVVSAILVAIMMVLISLMCGRIESAEQLAALLSVSFLGLWPSPGKKPFPAIDRWVDSLEGIRSRHGSDENAMELVLSNVEAASAAGQRLLVCGGAAQAEIARIADALQSRLGGQELLRGGDVTLDPNTVRGLNECDAVILVEQRGKSEAGRAAALVRRAQEGNKPVLGFVIL